MDLLQIYILHCDGNRLISDTGELILIEDQVRMGASKECLAMHVMFDSSDVVVDRPGRKSINPGSKYLSDCYDLD